MLLKLTRARYIHNKCLVTVSITANILLQNKTMFHHHHCIMFYMDVKYGLALRESTDYAGAKSAKKNTVTSKRTKLSETL
jgi:hypothetical protein